MNTFMQKEIRNSDGSDFPLVDYFKRLEKENKLVEPSDAALVILKSNNII